MYKYFTKAVLSVLLVLTLLLSSTLYVNEVYAAEPCGYYDQQVVDWLIGNENLPNRGEVIDSLPEAAEERVYAEEQMTGIIGDYLSWDRSARSVHFYPDGAYGHCALLFSKKEGKYIYWGAEKIGKHRAKLADGRAGERAFIPSTTKDAPEGYVAYVLKRVYYGKFYKYKVFKYIATEAIIC